jgi:hypothetical protein
MAEEVKGQVAEAVKEIKKFETADLALAAYIKFRGLPLVELDYSNRRKVTFKFEDAHGLAEQLALEFANSDFRKFDSEFEPLKS